MKKAKAAVLKEYRDEVSSMMEGRGVEKLYLGFLEDVTDEIIGNLPFPQTMRTMTEEEIVEDIHDIIYEELIRTYFKNTIVMRMNKAGKGFNE